MSGHSDHVAAEGASLCDVEHFIQKPFTPEALTQKLREALDV
jgi:hypothetical protein